MRTQRGISSRCGSSGAPPLRQTGFPPSPARVPPFLAKAAASATAAIPPRSAANRRVPKNKAHTSECAASRAPLRWSRGLPLPREKAVPGLRRVRSLPVLSGVAHFQAVAQLIERSAQPRLYGGKRRAQHLRDFL